MSHFTKLVMTYQLSRVIPCFFLRETVVKSKKMYAKNVLSWVFAYIYTPHERCLIRETSYYGEGILVSFRQDEDLNNQSTSALSTERTRGL